MTQQPVAVFDSGLGGLTVLRALRARLPHEDYFYFADTRFLPYGDKPEAFLRERGVATLRGLPTSVFDEVGPDTGTLGEVSSPSGADATVQTQEESGNLLIRLGSEGRTFTGVQRYRIDYAIRGLIATDQAQSGLDEFNWNAVGEGWEVPIEKATVKVTGPVDVSRVACFTTRGYVNTGTCTAASSGANVPNSPTSASCSTRSRSGTGSSPSVAITPSATWRSRLPIASITPQPVKRRPGSSPSSRVTPTASRRPHPAGRNSPTRSARRHSRRAHRRA